MIENKIISLFGNIGINVRYVTNEDKTDWQNILSGISYQPVAFSIYINEYYLEYFSQKKILERDFSMILYFEGSPIGIWPISVHKSDLGAHTIVSGSESVLPPMLITSHTAKLTKKIFRTCFEACSLIATHFQVKSWETGSGFVDSSTLTTWDRLSISNSIATDQKYFWFQNLLQNENEILGSFRKSYRSLVNAGHKYWNIVILDSTNYSADAFEEFSELHVQVSGRQTRSKETWNKQFEAIINNEALLIVAYDKNQVMKGGALFHFTRDESLYAVGVYSREELAVPVSHVIQATGILEFKRRGLLWHNLGVAQISRLSSESDIKEGSISNFKEGFASDLVSKISFRIDASVPTESKK